MGIGLSIEVINTIVREKVEKLETLAAKLGHANANSGGFRAKLAACQRYGLLVGKSTALNVSSLGKRIIHPKGEDERTQASAQAILNVDLFRRLYDKVGTALPPGEFWVTLSDIVNAERDEIMKKAPRIEAVFKEAVPILARYERLREEVEAAEVPTKAEKEPTATPAVAGIAADENTIVLVSPADGIELRLPRKESSIDLATKALEIIKSGLEGPRLKTFDKAFKPKIKDKDKPG